MSRPAKARIDLAAVRHNYRTAKSFAPQARAVAVIKANGYGHGAVRVAQALDSEADAFAVACLEEALELRESGVARPILLLEGVFEPDELALVDHAGLTPVIHNQEQMDWLLRARPSRPIDVWLKMDTGMHRVGLSPEQFSPTHAQLARCPHVGNIILMSHLARADEIDSDATDRQLRVFQRHTAGIDAPRSLANSAAVLAWPQSHGDWTRPGIMLFGATPLNGPHPHAQGLRPTMYLESALISVRELPAGEAIGYGARFVCARPTRVGVVAMGYADGYPRHARDGTPVLIKGQCSRVIGRVSMDMLTVDLTRIPDACIGDSVQLWGDKITANDVAAASDTIAYQLFTGVSRRVPMRYLDTD
ncbi:MAG: alanine racemase [Thiohalocapsa sp.]